jgi:hypothetical protein
MQSNDNEDSLRCFGERVAAIRRALPRQYDRQVNRDLARQRSDDLLLRNLVAVAEQAYADALRELRALPFDRQGITVTDGLSALTPPALRPFDGMVDQLLEYVVHKHRTSCALSNFPAEHKPSPDYIAAVMQAAADAWRAFAVEVNRHMLGFAEATAG